MLAVLPRLFRTAALGLAIPALAAGCSQSPASPISPGSVVSDGADLTAGPTDGGVTPVVIEGSPACSAVPGYTPEWQQFRLENREWRTPGTYGLFTVLPNSVPTHFFGWSASSLIVVKAVLMNGGTSANVYSYNAVTPPVVSTDTHLHSPVVSNGKPAPISHVTFCYVKPIPDDGGDPEGCTPGFWKNRAITIGAWDAAGVSPDATVSSVFAIGAFPTIGGTSLHAALDFGGGPGPEGAARNLIRAAVAAYLNASHGDLSYPLSAGDVVSQVNAALVRGSSTDNQWRQRMLNLAASLDTQNNLGCPL